MAAARAPVFRVQASRSGFPLGISAIVPPLVFAFATASQWRREEAGQVLMALKIADHRLDCVQGHVRIFLHPGKFQRQFRDAVYLPGYAHRNLESPLDSFGGKQFSGRMTRDFETVSDVIVGFFKVERSKMKAEAD